VAPWMSTDATPSRLITTPDWLAALFVQVSLTDVVPTAFAVRFDGVAGMGVSLADEAALAVDTVHKAATTAKATASSKLLDLVKTLFIVPPPLVLSRYTAGRLLEERNRYRADTHQQTLPVPALGWAVFPGAILSNRIWNTMSMCLK